MSAARQTITSKVARAVRKRMGWTHLQMATALAASPTRVKSLIVGQRVHFTHAELTTLVALGISPRFLITGEGLVQAHAKDEPDADLNRLLAAFEALDGNMRAVAISLVSGLAEHVPPRLGHTNAKASGEEFTQILLRLKQAVGLEFDEQIGNLLGIRKAAFSARKVRNSFPVGNLKALAFDRPELGLDVHFILTGERA